MKAERQKERAKNVKERKRKRKVVPNPKWYVKKDYDTESDNEDTQMTNCVQHIMLDTQHLLYANP
jgi:hypothetical protein